jgi:3-methyladenine DNA glycosylase/8-oxoguanine DNA glycosylase
VLYRRSLAFQAKLSNQGTTKKRVIRTSRKFRSYGLLFSVSRHRAVKTCDIYFTSLAVSLTMPRFPESKMHISIRPPRNFNFQRTVLSHGWYGLLPFEFDEKTWTLTRVLETKAGTPVTVRIRNRKRAIDIEADRPAGAKASASIQRDVRHMLRLDDDIAGFYDLVSTEAEFSWIPQQGAGRLLRSPTVFEDLVKMMCTTNCSWALTEVMTNSLVKNLGRAASDGRRTFPDAAAMAEVSEKFYRDEVRSGYRAPYLKELADRVASGSLDVEAWLKSDLPTSELKKEMKLVKGIGDYAAENLLKLVGRYDGLALDSWTRAKFAEVRNRGRVASDKKIARCYSRFDSWRGLALWCDMTKDWIEESNKG